MCTDVLPPSALSRLRRPSLSLYLSIVALTSTGPAWSAGTTAGTVIDNTAQVSFSIGGSLETIDSNTTSFSVAERIDVSVIPLSPQVFVSPGETNRALLFRVTNLGNGSEAFALSGDSVLIGDDFDPLPVSPAIYFDSDASGDLSASDVAYVPSGNDPLLAADESVDILLVNDIPSTVVDGQLGRSELTASALTGTGGPGDPFPGLGDGGVDALVGSSGGLAAEIAAYVTDDVQINLVKSVQVSDPFGGSDTVSGATLTYTVTIEVTSAGIAANSVFVDPIPANTSFVASSISLNGGGLTDATADDAGELDTSAAPTVVVRLGDLSQVSGVQTVSFDVVVD